MTDLELKELVANLAVRQTDSEQRMDRTERYLEQAARDLAESARNLKELDRQQQETARQIKELSRETDHQIKELGRETDRQIKELGRQIGGLGEKFGGFTEGMAFPSMTKILQQRFGMDVISTRVTSRKNGQAMEIDVLAHSNSRVDEVYAVEVKSHLRDEGVDQMLRILRDFHRFFAGHEGKKVYGILAAVDYPDDVRDRVLREGIYLARIHDENFEISVPEDFQPRAY
jgi:hypothetical protein